MFLEMSAEAWRLAFEHASPAMVSWRPSHLSFSWGSHQIIWRWGITACAPSGPPCSRAPFVASRQNSSATASENLISRHCTCICVRACSLFTATRWPVSQVSPCPFLESWLWMSLCEWVTVHLSCLWCLLLDLSACVFVAMQPHDLEVIEANSWVNGDLIFPKLCHLLVHFRAETLLKFWFVSQFHMLCFYRDALTTCTNEQMSST
jgi:hypothetical protein